MAAWLIPALKAVLPHVGAIISVATPVFTKKKVDVMVDATADQTLQQQISELQTAASQNSAQIKELAEQLQSTVAAVEQAASVAEAKLRRVLSFCVAATAVSLCLVLFLLLSR